MKKVDYTVEDILRMELPALEEAKLKARTKGERSMINRRIHALSRNIEVLSDGKVAPVVDVVRIEEARNLACMDIGDWKKNKADVLSGEQKKVLVALGHQELADAPVKDLALLFKTLYEAERLERGQSTSNVAIFAKMVDKVAGERI